MNGSRSALYCVAMCPTDNSLQAGASEDPYVLGIPYCRFAPASRPRSEGEGVVPFRVKSLRLGVWCSRLGFGRLWIGGLLLLGW